MHGLRSLGFEAPTTTEAATTAPATTSNATTSATEPLGSDDNQGSCEDNDHGEDVWR